jgi:2-oxoglutarate dehydrogenase E1 component
MLLPHGFDGAGPEHSSARLERFLQLCDDNPFYFPPMEPNVRRQIQDCNMQVAYCSTPANYFHVLRRQVHRDFRKPLILMTSKSLLRHPMCKSTLAEMAKGTHFTRLYPETSASLLADNKINKVIFCTGQVYFALARTRDANQMNDIAIVRVEQISPFPFDLVAQQADRYPNAKVVWAQEEPLNMGAWSYAEPRIITALKHTQHHKNKVPTYAGRDPTGAVATGSKKQHEKEEIALLSHALLGEFRQPKKVRSQMYCRFIHYVYRCRLDYRYGTKQCVVSEKDNKEISVE